MNGYASVAAALVFLMLLFAAARTKVGYAFLYYFVLGSILLVFLVGSPKIASIFKGGSA